MQRFSKLTSIASYFNRCGCKPNRFSLSLNHHENFPSVISRSIQSKSTGDKLRRLQWATFLSLCGLTAGGVLFMSRDLEKERSKIVPSLGRPDIGGDFNLIDHNGKPCTLADFKGKWLLLYFGFCRCPDICPEQLENVCEICDRVALLSKSKHPIVPVFITVDAERDTPELVAEYVKEFSPKLVGLTGTKEQIDQVAKRYRIYYSAGPKDVDGDYIVDHTVVMYLLDPNGNFVEYFGQNKAVPDVTRGILDKIAHFSG